MQQKKHQGLPSLNALRAFEAAARHLSFTLAARELCVTQGAVSRQIKQLEDQLKVILFHRRHKQLSLTDQGMLLVPSLTRAFNMMADAVNKLKNQQQDLSLKVHPTFAIRWLIPRLHHFQTLHPDIQVRLTTSGANVDFGHENFDIGITHLGKASPGVIREKIMTEQLIPVCSPKLLTTAFPLKRPGDLRGHMLLHNTPDLREWAAWADQVGIKNLSLERGQVFEVDDAALQAATAGLGVALGDLFLVRDALAAGLLVAPFGLTPIKTGNYYFSRPESNKDLGKVTAFQNWLVSALRQTG
ncbi:MAG: transcriptional regulator GcvA [Proteobacteria bacterium]|nr:transcriptional regulator GcvA [Desulfobacula sp.]MBU3951107.1 transcriptional regulator GcvA [Pseudomonadota bacterium]MBU4129199.1 transcriptional regulator GcvA [Pseudomonadota bacterium]